MSTIRQEVKIEISIYAVLTMLLFAAIASIIITQVRTTSIPSIGTMQWSVDSASWKGWQL